MSSDQRSEFAASYDKMTKILSAVFCVFMLAAAAAIHDIIFATVMILVAVLTYAYSPTGYNVSGKAITVKRLVGNIRVPLENLVALRRINVDDLRGSVRLWGSGGLFGYYGLFRTTKLGKCTWYATNRKNIVALIGASKTTVYSPDDVEGFLDAIRAEVPVPGSEASMPAGAGFETARRAAGRTASWIGLICVMLAVLGALAGIYALLTLTSRGIL